MAEARGAGNIGVGTVLADTYEIVGLIGRGGMGAVWEATHRRLPGKSVAIKVLHGDAAADADALARFRREAEIASRLGHPNIVQVHDFNILDDGTPYLILEYLRGEALDRRIARGRISWDDAAGVLRQVGAALRAAHDEGVVHRDLKPQNILLVPTDADGRIGEQAKVLDFGISKIRGSQTVQTQTQAVLGTPQYMAPEQALGRHAEVDGRTDVFALGAIAYEMLCGEPAFPGTSVPEVVFKVVYEEPAPLAKRAPLVPARAIEAVGRALSKAREHRWNDVSSFLEALTGRPLATLRGAGAARAAPPEGPDVALRETAAAAPASDGVAVSATAAAPASDDVAVSATAAAPASAPDPAPDPAPDLDPDPDPAPDPEPAPDPDPDPAPAPGAAPRRPRRRARILVAAVAGAAIAGGAVVLALIPQGAGNSAATARAGAAASASAGAASASTPAPSPAPAAAADADVPEDRGAGAAPAAAAAAPRERVTSAGPAQERDTPPRSRSGESDGARSDSGEDRRAETGRDDAGDRDRRAERQDRPRRKRSLPPPVRRDLADAADALRSGKPRRGLFLASRAQRERTTGRGFALVARSYCALSDLGNARAAFLNVPRRLRARVRRSCRRHGVPLE